MLCLTLSGSNVLRWLFRGLAPTAIHVCPLRGRPGPINHQVLTINQGQSGNLLEGLDATDQMVEVNQRHELFTFFRFADGLARLTVKSQPSTKEEVSAWLRVWTQRAKWWKLTNAMSEQPVCYLDNNATTRVAPEVVEAMVPFLKDYWGNPSSAYSFGHQVAEHVEEARAKVAALIHADPREIVFTSCGTESNNAAIHSALVTQPEKRHVITTAVEHSANIKYGQFLQKEGCEVTFLPVESDGSLDLHLVDLSIRPDTAIVSIMCANNETGVLFPIEEIAAI